MRKQKAGSLHQEHYCQTPTEEQAAELQLETAPHHPSEVMARIFCRSLQTVYCPGGGLDEKEMD